MEKIQICGSMPSARFSRSNMAAEKSNKNNGGNRLTPVLRIELSPIQELRELHCQTYKTNVQPKCDKKRKEYDQKLQE